jgi:two-component system sensor histidine kinase UhpB
MAEGLPRRRVPRRLLVLLGFGVGAPLLAATLLGASGLQAMSRALALERQTVAGMLAARWDAALDARLQALAGLGSLADPAAAPERARAALHQVWRASQPLESVSLFDAGGRELLREPASASAATLPTVHRPAVVGPLDAPRGARVLLVYPLADHRGHRAATAVGSLDPADPRWRFLLELRPARPDLQLRVEDAQGRALAQAGHSEAGAAAATAPLASAPWRVVVRAGSDPSRSARRGLYWLLPLLLALALLFGRGAARSVTEPVALLTAAAGRIADGDLERPVPGVGEDEVGQLGRALEAMRVALRRDRSRGQLLARVIAAQEEERKRIGRELHDETCQTLAALALAARSGRSAEAEALAGRALDGIRGLIHDLRPAVLDDLGLAAAIHWLAERHLESRGIAVRCEVEEPLPRLRPEAETALFRAVQEALVNVSRHARAEAVLIQAASFGDTLRIEIEDDGCGFDPGAVAAPSPDGRGLGLVGMRERLSLVGGSLEIEAAPGRGTRVVLEAPAAAGAP